MAVQETSREALNSVDRRTYQQRVYQVIDTLGPISNLEIAEALGLPINYITEPCFQLRKKDLVTESHRGPSPITGRNSIFWKAA